MNLAVLAKAIRAKVALGVIQGTYTDQPMLHWGGAANTHLCLGCNARFVGEMAVGYRSYRGGLHWFHLGCDEIRKVV